MSEESDKPPRRRWSSAVRATAATLAVATALATVAPPLASAREAESEGEGSAPPGTVLPGLEEGFEPGGEETGLGEVTIGTGEAEAEEAPPVEIELSVPPEVEGATPRAASPPPAVEEAPATKAAPPTPESPPTAATAPTGPVYETGEAAPTYEAQAPVEAVRNEAIVAPASQEPRVRPERSAPKAPAPAPVAEEGPEPEPVETPEEPTVAAPSAVSVTGPDRAPGSLSGHEEHMVAPGESLWSIAEAVLPPGASEARVAAEVDRLWRLNAARIGTGDPNLIYAGTVLRLHG